MHLMRERTDGTSGDEALHETGRRIERVGMSDLNESIERIE